MKTILYIFAVIILSLAIGCKSSGLLLEEGKYDEAITSATQKLANTDNKKTKDIKTLEKAFEKSNQRDLSSIERLKVRARSGEGSAWEEVYDYTMAIEQRQDQLASLLPLTSKDGYEGQFDFIEVNELKTESSSQAAAHLYQLGIDQVAHALKTRDKKIAQEAYANIEKIGKYFNEYQNVVALKQHCKNVGTYNILLKVDVKKSREQLDIIIDAESAVGKLNPWIEYHDVVKEGIDYDAITTISIDDIYVSPEEESVQNLSRQRTVVPPVSTSTSDSLGTTTSTPLQMNMVTIELITRKKECRILASVETQDFDTGELLYQKSFSHNEVFESKGRTGYGGSAVNNSNGGVDENNFQREVKPFPFDIDMKLDGINEISEDIFRYMSKIDSEDLRLAGIAAE